ncbi:MAG: MoaD/ThiS family protein [Deltaproteobacteria bacterium]|nr:MoaD/ThiS family protein [Deltaproteobacteria bacterium]
MQIRVKLFGVFRIDRFKEENRDYPPGIRVREVVDELSIPGVLLGIILINGVHSNGDAILQDGDSLSLLPLLGGG